MIIKKKAELILTEKEADLFRDLNNFIEEHFKNSYDYEAGYDLDDEFKANFICHLMDWDEEWSFENVDVRIIN